MRMIRVFSVFLICFYSHFSIAACEEERRRAERATQVLNDWSAASGITGIAGLVIGGYFFGKPGACVGGLSGLIPGVGAKRAHVLKDKREEILKACLSAHAVEQERKRAEEQQVLVRLCAQNAGQYMGRLFMERKVYYQELALRELDEYLEELVDSDHTQEEIEVLLEDERLRINAKYF
ncbi:hypothetical protein EBS43_02685 [bacterium]|jgi:hypothetical protein|nr:hypothetical protein [bacterium]